MDVRVSRVSVLLAAAEHVLPDFLSARPGSAARPLTVSRAKQGFEVTNPRNVRNRRRAREFSFSHLPVLTRGEISATLVCATDEPRMAGGHSDLLRRAKFRPAARPLLQSVNSMETTAPRIHHCARWFSMARNNRNRPDFFDSRRCSMAQHTRAQRLVERAQRRCLPDSLHSGVLTTDDADFCATHNPETPNGIFRYLNTKLSAPSSRPSTPFSAGTLMLFSLAAFIPVMRINCRTNSIGRKNVMFAYVVRSISKPACSSTRLNSLRR